MAVPTYAQLITLSSTANGLVSESLQERLLTIAAMLASGTGPDGTSLPAGASFTGLATASAQGSGSANYSTASASFVNMDGTNLTITPTNAHTGDVLRVEAWFSTSGSNTTNDQGFTFNIAGTDVGDTEGLVICDSNANTPVYISFDYTMPSNTQPTINLRFRMGGAATCTVQNNSATVRPHMRVTNLNRGGTL